MGRILCVIQKPPNVDVQQVVQEHVPQRPSECSKYSKTTLNVIWRNLAGCSFLWGQLLVPTGDMFIAPNTPSTTGSTAGRAWQSYEPESELPTSKQQKYTLEETHMEPENHVGL